ncbi:LysR family transcriptional regulator [Clostridium sp. SHJSY1]|uniref:LysR family transcriptional regulator n=1 Tax=Clostridium sp. SHJSY1 TaxID=2942483 RepID=UPI002874BF4E|nr:LysR family transcriptional regulator [Clostridium sp. SHJSY1]MDS0524197.1 LysR family transcriptional regulator [Clostridium sp. SHJSY1]
MNIRQLKYFLAVAENLNFTKAAEKYYISQTAITQQIQSLEKELNVKLFNRTNRHVELTPSGAVFVKEAESLINHTKEAIERTQIASTGFTGSLSIGFVKGYEQTSFSKLIQSFYNKFPNISLFLVRDNIENLYLDLVNKKRYDIIFNVNYQLEKYDNINYKVIENHPLIVVVYSNHHFANRNTLKKSDLKNELFIANELYKNPNNETLNINSTYTHPELIPSIAKQSRDIETILLMVSSGMGIAVLPDYTIKSYTNFSNLVYIPLDEEEYIETIAAWNKDNSNPSLTKFLESL